MKKTILLLTLLNVYAFAQSFLISNIPIPKSYIQDLDPYECDETCLDGYIAKGMIFSFLAKAPVKLENKDHNDIRMMNISILNLGAHIISGDLKIALLLPNKIIGRYASSTTNASFAYLITKNHAFELKNYQIETEEYTEIQSTLQKIQEDGFSYVIAPLTKKGADNVASINPELNIYFPTINKKDSNSSSPYLYYGGIDYEAQSDTLLKEAVSPLVVFYDKSNVGRKLANYQEEHFKYKKLLTTNNENNVEIFSAYTESPQKVLDKNKKVIKFSIPRRTTNLEYQLKKNKNIVEGSFFLNTPIVKSGMIMSQITMYDTNATNVLSTQINYDPLILSMTQYTDRKNMIIANSITIKNNVFIETNAILGNDIVYDWINYTTTVGVDLFFNQVTNEQRDYKIDMLDNQMIYPIELIQPSVSRFKNYQSSIE